MLQTKSEAMPLSRGDRFLIYLMFIVQKKKGKKKLIYFFWPYQRKFEMARSRTRHLGQIV